MQNQNSFVSFIWQAATLALLFSLIVLLTLFLTVPAVAQSFAPAPYALSVTHNATERGVISPGCAALITLQGDGQFIGEPMQATRNPLPFEINGITVTIGGLQAQIRLATPNQLAVIAPDVPLPVSRRRLAWFNVVVNTPTDTFTGWAAYAPTAPGLYEQTTGKTRHVQGMWRIDRGAVMALDGSPILAGSRVVLLGSGMRDARTLRVWIDDGFDLWIVDATLAVNQPEAIGGVGWAGFAWIEGVAFDLPPDAKGNLALVVQADLMWSQEFWLTTF